MKLIPKYRPVLVALLLVIVHVNSYSQAKVEPQQNFQSEMTDSVRIVSLIELSEEKQYLDLTEATLHANEALKIAESKNWDWARGLAYKRLSFLASISGDYTSAMKLDNSFLQIALAIKDSALIVDALSYLGNYYHDLSIYD